MKLLKKNAIWSISFCLLAVTVISCNDDDNGPTDKEAPVITLIGEDTVNLSVGYTFTDPGATATDSVDGDITENIVVGGDAVDTNTAGMYTITYNVTDEAGNAAIEVARTVIVSEGIAANGDFESGETGWLFFNNNGTAMLDNSLSNGGGSNSAKISTNGPSNPGIKQERIGVGIVQAGDVVQIQFDHIGSVTEPGAVFNVLLFVERVEGEDGVPITHVFDPKPTLTDTWTTFTATYTIPNNASVTGGISF